jgi:eukaryotic-like serine/threonine-protein kinase
MTTPRRDQPPEFPSELRRARWSRVRQVFEAAVALPVEQRLSFVEESCRDDEAAHSEVVALLDAHQRSAGFLEIPAVTLLEDVVRPDLSGRRIGPYEFESRIGRGGMGDVYRGRDTRLGRTIAIKVLAWHAATSVSARVRFEQEARTIAALNHPHICALYDVGSGDGVDFLVMEFLEGETLAARLTRGPMHDSEVIAIAAQIASALDRAHRTGIVHRDLKPSNIILTESGAKLLDFGIAKLHDGDVGRDPRRAHDTPSMLTGAGGILGTVAYMSPEQVRGEPVDARSDMFSLGTMLYEMLRGSRPFAGQNTEDLCAAILRGAAAIPDFDDARGLDIILKRLLQPDREHRYPDAAAMHADLQRLHRAPAGKGWWRSAAALLALTIVGAAVWLLLSRDDAPAQPVSSVRAVAVLPFTPLAASDGDSDYLGVALADALVTELGAVDTVAVRPSSGMARFAASGTDPVAIGRALNAELVVHGAIQRAGDQLRVTVHLVRVGDGLTVWSERFNARWTDVFSVQDAIAEQVASALAVPLTRDDRVRVQRRRPGNVDAYEAYLKGRYFWNMRTAEGLTRALGYFEDALRRDANYAQAHAGLADTYAVLGSTALAALPPREAGPKAIAAAARALEIDGTLAEAHVSYAFAVYSYEWDWARGEEHFRRAIALDADYATAHYWYSLFLDQLGRLDEAAAEAQLAVELEPLSPVGTYAVGLTHYCARRFDRAREYARRILEVDPEYPLGLRLLGSTLVAEGRFMEAIEPYEQLARAAPDNSLYAGWLAHVYGRAGRSQEARQILSRFNTPKSGGNVAAANIAIGYIGVGDHEAALSWLEQAYDDHSQALTYLKIDPVYDPLRGDARFAALVRRVGLN